MLFIEGWRGEKGGGEIEGGHKITHLTLTLQNTGSRHFTSAQADEIVVEEEKKETIEEEDVAVEGADDPRVQPSCNVRHAIASVDVRLMKSMQLTEVSLHHAHLFYLGLFFLLRIIQHFHVYLYLLLSIFHHLSLITNIIIIAPQ